MPDPAPGATGAVSDAPGPAGSPVSDAQPAADQTATGGGGDVRSSDDYFAHDPGPGYTEGFDFESEGPGSSVEADPSTLNPQPSTPLHEDFYSWGEYLGLSRDAVDQFPGGQPALERVIQRAYERETAQARRGARIDPNTVRASQDPHAQQRAEAARRAEQLREYIGDYEFPAEQAELVDDVLKGVNTHYNQRFGQLERVVHQLYQEANGVQRIAGRLMHGELERQQAQYQQMAHRAIDQIDPELFGTGDEATPEQRQNRLAVLREVARLDQAFYGRGEQLPAIDHQVLYASRALFGDRLAQRRVAEAARATQNKARRAPARPTNSRPKAPPRGDDAAIRAASNWLRQHPDDGSTERALVGDTAVA